MKANIIICGKSGAGKTSLVQAVTRPGTVPDEAINQAELAINEFAVYQTDAANFIDCAKQPDDQEIAEYAQAMLAKATVQYSDAEMAEQVHSVWYCLDGSSGKVPSAEAKLISKLPGNTLLIVTKTEQLEKSQTAAIINELLLLIPRERIVLISSVEKRGLQSLIDKAQEIVEEVLQPVSEGDMLVFRRRWTGYYQDIRSLWEARTEAEADEFIKWAAGRAAVIALVPLPLADVGPLIANEAYMIYKIGAAYGYAVDKTVFTMLAGVAGGSIAGKVIASFFPFLKVAIAAGITYAVGRAAKAYFASGMTLNPAELKKSLKAQKQRRKLT